MRKAISLLFLVASVTACVQSGDGEPDGGTPSVDASVNEDASAPPPDAPSPDAPTQPDAGVDAPPMPDLPIMTLEVIDGTATEEGETTGLVRIRRTGNLSTQFDLYFGIYGSATPDDYEGLTEWYVQFAPGQQTALIYLTPVDDNIDEGDEENVFFSLWVSSETNPRYLLGNEIGGEIKIIDNDVTSPPPTPVVPNVVLQVTDDTATEQNQTSGQFLITRTGSTSGSLAVSYVVSGSATGGVDYVSLQGTAVIQAGDTSVSIMVMPVEDALVEGNETVTVSMSSSPSYTIVGLNNWSVTIQDNDQPPTPTPSVNASANPANRATPGSSVISWTASNLGTNPSCVTVWNGATVAGSTGSTPVNVTTVGQTTFIVWCSGSNGSAMDTATVTVSAPPDNCPPSVQITSPANGTNSYIAPATVLIRASASDSDGNVTQVQFLADGVVVGTDTTSPYEFNWTNVPAGTKVLKAKAFDNDGDSTMSAPVSITVNNPAPNLPPTVSISFPLDEATYVAPANGVVTAVASDTDGSVVKVDFYSGTLSLGTDTSAPYQVNLTNVPVGNYVLTAKATDDDGAYTVSAPIDVHVTSPLPNPTLDFTITPAVGGGGYVLAWDSNHADVCVSSGAWTGPRALDGTFMVNPTVGTYNFTMTCTRTADGVWTASTVPLTVSAPPAPTLCHGSGAYYKNSDLPYISTCKGWSREGVPQTLTKGNLVLGPDGVCAITCHDEWGFTILPVGGKSVWVPGAVQDSPVRYTSGCVKLPGHEADTNPPSGIAWDLMCSPSTPVTVLTGPPNTNL